MARVLVVGAGGYIGIPLCEELARRGHVVYAVDRWFFGRKPSGVVQVLSDIRTFNLSYMANIVLHPDGSSTVRPWPTMDAVIDLAGLSNDASADIDPELTASINRDGAMNLATLAKEAGVRRYIYSSSCSVYGHGVKHDLTETDDLKPLTLYAVCKAQVEDHLRSLESKDFGVTILRNATVFGVAPRMRFDLVANIMAMTAWRDHQIIVRGGEQYRPFVHVRDLIEAFASALTNAVPFGTYNVGRCNLTINELAKEVTAVAPWSKITRVTEAVDLRDYHVSFKKYERISSPMQYTIRRGVEEVITALRNEEVRADDPTTVTLNWYRSLIEWDKRLSDIRLDGRLL